MSTTVLDLITLSLSELGEYDAGETIASEDSDLGLKIFNSFIDLLNADAAVIYSILRTTWTITASTASYAVGTGSTVNVARPASPNDINGIGFYDSSLATPQEMNVALPLTEQAYQNIPQKTLTSVYPQFWYYTPTLATGTLKPWPIPTSSTLTGVMYHGQRLAEYTGLTDIITMPYGYREWFRLELARRMAPSFGAQFTPEQAKMLLEAQMIAKRANKRPVDMVIEAAALGGVGLRGGGRYNIYTDN